VTIDAGVAQAETVSGAEFRATYPRESDTVEFKAGAGQEPLQRSMAAFSNTAGGVILVGADDDGVPVGVADPAAVTARVHTATRDVRDLGRYAVRVIQVDGRAVVAITVARRIHGFAQLANGLVLVRRGEHDMPLFGAELATFLMGRQMQRFESQPADATLADAADDAIDDVIGAHGWNPEDPDLTARLTERGLLAASGESLTVAGALFLAPAKHEGLGKAYVEVRRYPDDGDAYDKRLTLRGPLQVQVRETTRVVMNELGNDFVVSGIYRYEMPKLPEVVIREAVANAVAHRSYEASGTATVVEVRPGRVVVRSPGGLPEGVTVENLRDAQSARNLIVIDVLRKFRVAEDAGRGVDVMQDRMSEALLDPPRFTDLGHAFEVVLPVHSAITPEERAWIMTVERQGRLEQKDALLLLHAARGERLTNAVARAVLGADSVQARAALKRLCQAGFLSQHGTRGGATYVLEPNVRTTSAARRSPEELAELVLEHAAREPLSNQVVRQITGLQRDEALALLRGLVRDGRLRQVGERRGVRYVLSQTAIPLD
jgi:ATP-dependent DNA helicase RecG